MATIHKGLTELEAQVEASRGADAAAAAVRDVRRAASALLNRQFIYGGDRGAAHLYEATIKRRAMIEEALDLFGYELVHEGRDGWVGIVPDPDVPSAAAMLRTDETIVVLLLGLVWQEGMNQGASEDRAVIRTNSRELFDRHAAILGRERIGRTRFAEVLNELRRRSVVALGEEDPETRDVEIEIRSNIRPLAGEAPVEILERFADRTEAELDALEREARHAAEEDPDAEPAEDADIEDR
ncbi:DUF4194 domain-containing protein [Arenibaculum sp.]|jgi:hypothetical protein|uniref:DUF4194 domain-containing protein n=1 Tax=Arenibaculum sp. TaxID=2865862 RepID=UPI002E13ED2E|nr:DUF4194 domain-containing protein [Arenibaculum sp.]